MTKPMFIIGGMGPQASVELLRLIVKLSATEFGAKNDEDFPEIVLRSVGVPNFIANEANKTKALKKLKQVVGNLSIKDFSMFAIACNTAHLLVPELIKSTNVPFVSMIDAVVKEAQRRKLKRIGLLASPTTIRTGLYRDAFVKVGIEVLMLEDKQSLTKIEQTIRAVIAGKNIKLFKVELEKLAKSLIQQGAEAIILGCTELPVIFVNNKTDKFISSTECLARELLERYYNGQS